MNYKVGEWGEVTEFSSLTKALKYCKDKNISPTGDNGLLWIHGNSRKEMNDFRINNKHYNEEFVNLVYEGRSKMYVWCSVYKKWEDYNEYFGIEED